MKLDGIYLGVVEKVTDPERLGRIKVRVPSVYGIIGSAVGAIPIDDLPWALPLGLPAGSSPQSGGADWLPQSGDQVAVQFIDGEPEKPVWAWFMQSVPHAANFKLHQYTELAGQVGQPKRGAWTRYGHTVEWNEGSLIATTAGGYRLFLLDGTSDGAATISTQLGQFLELNDDSSGGLLNILEDFYMVIGLELNILAGNIRLETVNDFRGIIGTDLSLSVGGSMDVVGLGTGAMSFTDTLELFANGNVTVATDLSLLLDYGATLTFGAGSTEPFVLGTQLSAFLTSLLAWLSTHVHESTSPGAPTSPPLVPPTGVVLPEVVELISTTIFGK